MTEVVTMIPVRSKAPIALNTEIYLPIVIGVQAEGEAEDTGIQL
jgi:hypothetical protein